MALKDWFKHKKTLIGEKEDLEFKVKFLEEHLRSVRIALATKNSFADSLEAEADSLQDFLSFLSVEVEDFDGYVIAHMEQTGKTNE